MSVLAYSEFILCRKYICKNYINPDVTPKKGFTITHPLVRKEVELFLEEVKEGTVEWEATCARIQS